MVSDKRHEGRQELFNTYVYLPAIFALSTAVFIAAGIFRHQFSKIMEVATYLTWHNLFEFSAILVCFAVFLVTYYSFDQTKRLRSLILCGTFLMIGMLDAFHTLSYKGMPDFFVPNDEANRATTYWIISRLISAGGFLSAALTHAEKKTNIKKGLLFSASLLACLAVFIVVTYFPGVVPPMYIEGEGLTEMKVALEYTVIMMFTAAGALFYTEYLRGGDTLVLQLAGALLFSVFSEYAFVNYLSVYDIYNYIGHIYKFLAFCIFFRVVFVKNVELPYTELSKAQDELRLYAENLDRLVEKRTGQLKEMNRKLLNDLDYARDIQKALLPSKLPREDGVCFEARYFPAERVGGDFYNAFRIDKDNVAMYIGDVSGHGVPAAMLMIFINQSIRTRREMFDNSAHTLQPSSMLKNIYRMYNSTNFKEDVYIILLYAVYNTRTRLLTYASAGMNTFPILVRRSGEVEELYVKGFPVCKFLEYYQAEYEDIQVELDKGDRVLFYTDGLIESRDSGSNQFSAVRLREVLESCTEQGADKIVSAIERNLFNFMNVSMLRDDITFLVMEVR